MKLFLAKPGKQKILELLRKFESEQCSHQKIGSTKNWPLQSFGKMPDSKVDDGDLLQFRRVSIGTGEAEFVASVNSVRNGVCFDMGWAELYQIRNFHDGDVFGLLTKAFGFWTASFCRIVYLCEEETKEQKLFSMGIGTLPCHAATGEERMSILWQKDSDEVDFLIGSFSRPRAMLSRIFVSFLRRQQDRFAEDSAECLRQAIATSKKKDFNVSN